MPATFQIGVNTAAVCIFTESPVPAVGPVTFSGDNPAVATVDPSSGAVTIVGPGSVNFTGTDTANGVSASDTLTVLAAPQTATLTIQVT